MKKVIILRHQNEMKLSRDFFQMEIPKELSRTVYLIVSVCFLIVLLMIFGQIDDVIKTQGVVRTKENVSFVQNVIAGKIVELNYEPGQKVFKDDVLYKIDSSTYEAQRNMLQFEIQDLQFKISGLKCLIDSFYSDKNLCDRNNNILAFSQFDAYLKEKEVLEIQKNIAEKEFNFENQKPQTIRNAYEVGMKLQSLNLAEANFHSFKTRFIANIILELNDKTNLLYEKQQNLTQLDNQYIFLEIKAPMSGYVQEISSLNVGDYLESNSKVLNIIPNDNENFRVEIRIAPKDMGKIIIGQKVKYRLSAFPYFEYKGAEGFITSIDPDIRALEESDGIFYSVYADIDRVNFSNRQGDSFPIRAGLETDVRIVLERKPIIYFILKKLDFLY